MKLETHRVITFNMDFAPMAINEFKNFLKEDKKNKDIENKYVEIFKKHGIEV